MDAEQKLAAKIAAQSTEALVEIATRLNLVPTTEAVIVCNRVERELESRMSPEDFLAHLDAMDAMLDAAA